MGAVVVEPDCQIEGVLERSSLFLSTSGRRSMSGSCNPSPQSGFGSKKTSSRSSADRSPGAAFDGGNGQREWKTA
ncbi:hypothetical protein ACFX2G_021216 [Malus domestica]